MLSMWSLGMEEEKADAEQDTPHCSKGWLVGRASLCRQHEWWNDSNKVVERYEWFRYQLPSSVTSVQHVLHAPLFLLYVFTDVRSTREQIKYLRNAWPNYDDVTVQKDTTNCMMEEKEKRERESDEGPTTGLRRVWQIARLKHLRC